MTNDKTHSRRKGSSARGGASPIRFHYPIALLLTALAVLPLIGAGWFAIADVRNARAAQAEARSIDASVTRLVLLTELQTRLLDEQNWSSVLDGIQEIGVSNEFVASFTGLNVPQELATAQSRVDELTRQLQLQDVQASVNEIREMASISGYTELENSIETDVAVKLKSLLDGAGDLRNGSELVSSLRVLEASATARQATSEQFTAFFGSQFSPVSDTTTELIDLKIQKTIRANADTTIEALTPQGAAADAFEAIRASEEANRFIEATNALLTRGLSPDPSLRTNSLALILRDSSSVEEVFLASSITTWLYFELVDAAGNDVRLANATIGASAASAAREATVVLVGFIVLSLVVTALAIVAVGRPIRRLAATARGISNGDSAVRFRGSGGSSEIRDAGRAINEAVEHLKLAEQQAKALSEGDLDHPILLESTSGQLGASLQQAVGKLASSMQDREEFRRRMTHEASHDGLTQLSNRKAALAQLERGLSRTKRSETLLAVFFIDLDEFKAVNDNHGHHAGDVVLRAVAHRLVNAVRAGDHVGRLGGDEFVVIAECVTGISEATQLAERLRVEVAKPIDIDSVTVSINASVGITISDGSETVSADALLQDADLAVYKAKDNGRGRVELCDDALRADRSERADLERAIRHALMENEFELYYQPVVLPQNQKLKSVEALIRWNRPGHGMVFPDGFIPFAERSDLIIDIDRWVIGAAVRQLREWEDAGVREGISVAVNISSRHLSSGTFVEDIFNPLLDFRIRPERLIVEVTESALLDDLDLAATKLQTLRNRGIRTAIDDFGTGYTSLAHLKSLPIDILKIDRSFTNDESASSLVKLIIDIGHLLGAKITAEGIETPQQAQHLTQLGTDDLQGYLYSKPIPAEQLRLELMQPAPQKG